VLRLRGSWRADTREGEPIPEPGVPPCPDWLDEDARVVWNEVAPQLDRMGVLGHIDQRTLGRYCDTWGHWYRARDFIKRHGDTYPLKDESGRTKYLQQFPQVAIANKLATQLTRLEQEFGMTPASRTRIQVNPAALPMTEREAELERFFTHEPNRG
jgi:P27 family predicted phage terminase small subunit